MGSTTARRDAHRRFHVVLRPGAVGLLVTYLLAGLLIALVATGGQGSPTHLLRIAAEFTLLALGAAIGHELGHAYIAVATGRRVRALILKLGAGVVIDTGGGRLGNVLVALGGPVASLLIAIVYVGLGDGISSPATWAGLLALADAGLNLVPLTRKADGARALAALNA